LLDRDIHIDDAETVHAERMRLAGRSSTCRSPGKAANFDGTYTEVEVDAELAGEGYTGAVENQHGVVIGFAFRDHRNAVQSIADRRVDRARAGSR